MIGGLEPGFLIMVNADLADNPFGAGADEIGILGFDPFAGRGLTVAFGVCVNEF
jgi:hypothetical protein